MKILKVLLILVAVVCIGVAISYPIRYKMELDSNNSELEDLSDMRRRVMEEQHVGLDAEAGEAGEPEAAPEAELPLETRLPDTAEPTAQAAEQAALTEPATVTEEGASTEITAVTEEQPSTKTTAVPEEKASTKTTTVPEAEASTEATALSEAEASTETKAVPEAEASTEATASSEEAPVVEATLEPAKAAEATAQPGETARTETLKPAVTDAVTAIPLTPTPGIMDLIINDIAISTPTPRATSTPTPSPSPSPSPTPDRSIRDDPDTFKDKVKIRLDVNSILPELREIYALNHDLVGWLYIDDTNIDYPVVQSEDRTFYLSHDFYGKSNANGQIILEDKCDPYTPSYNLVLSGHHMNSGAMFGRLGKYKDKDYWETHKIVEFDTLMARKRYVIFGAFYSADYNENEEGFRYSADIQYKLDADRWLDEIRANQIYETGVEAEFGDEFITLTTCDHSRRYNGRFVVVARRIREGEKIL